MADRSYIRRHLEALREAGYDQFNPGMARTKNRTDTDRAQARCVETVSEVTIDTTQDHTLIDPRRI